MGEWVGPGPGPRGGTPLGPCVWEVMNEANSPAGKGITIKTAESRVPVLFRTKLEGR
jgi:hypothetical protein